MVAALIDFAPAEAGYEVEKISGNLMAEVRLGTSSQPVPGRLGAVPGVGPIVELNVVLSVPNVFSSVVPGVGLHVVPSVLPSAVPSAVPTAGPTAAPVVDCTGPVGGSLTDDAGT